MPTQVIAAVVALATFRTIPVAVLLARLPGTPLALRIGALLACAAGVWLLGLLGIDPVAFTWDASTGYAAVFLTACALHPLAEAHAAGVADRGGVLTVSVVGFLVIPSLILSGGALSATLVLGWDAALRMTSYCIDRPTSVHGMRAFRDRVTFVIVGPHLVYPLRGQPIGPPRLRLKACARIAAGAVLTALSGIGLVGSQRVADSAWLDHPALSQTISHGLALGALCASHMGLASVQIGLMAIAGFRVEERYRRPWLAMGPADFFRRWNVWVGAWIHRYVFRPIAQHRARPRRFPTAPLAVTAYGASFLFVGLMHDLVASLDRLDEPRAHPRLGFGVLFAAFGAMLALTALSSRQRRVLVKLRSIPGGPVALRTLWLAALFAVTYAAWPHLAWVGDG